MNKLRSCTHCFFLMTLLLSFKSNAQLNKWTWLVGGSGSFSSTKNTYTSQAISQTSDATEINVSANVGYFLLDKFVAGLKPSYTKNKNQVNTPGGGYRNENRIELGPFARYYFLANDKPFNLLTEASYQFGVYSFKPAKGNINTLSLMAGPVLYFNSSVGLEFLFGYYKRNETIEDIDKTENKGFRISIGLQFHLESE
ncbi:MAG TPA: hypothetical protein VK166_01085 [Chitinophagaceae bacterium]|nr:hypothetical protein [Chitinophagaceae bacterium]